MTLTDTERDRWVVAGMNSGGNKNIYHTDRECSRLQSAKNPRRVQPGEDEYHDLEECKFCSGDAHVHSDFKLKECPFCGAMHKELCYHYPNCEEAP